VTIEATKSGSVIKWRHFDLESDTSQRFVFILGKLSMSNASTPEIKQGISNKNTTGILPISPRNGEEGKKDIRPRDLTEDLELICRWRTDIFASTREMESDEHRPPKGTDTHPRDLLTHLPLL